MRINNNLMANNASRMLNINNNSGSKSMEKLSSGYRINKAGDDAAGLAISEKMRAQIRGLNQASKNAQDGISLLQTAEGGLNETHSILQRMRELAVQGANDTLQTADRNAIQTEITELSTEVTRIAEKTTFNGASLLNGKFGSKVNTYATAADAIAAGYTGTTTSAGTLAVGADGVEAIVATGAKANETFTIAQTANKVTLTDGAGNVQAIDGLANTFTGTLNFDKLGISIKLNGADLSGAASWGGDGKTITTVNAAAQRIQIGANSGEELAITIGNMDATALGVNALSVADNSSAKAAITAVESAIGTVSNERSRLGAWQNRLEHTINNLGTSSENLTAAESRIRDVDMASEMVEYTKNDILQQAAQAMLAKANQAPQNVLQLLR